MLLLGIDTSGKTASAALFDSDNEVFLASSSLYTSKTHSQVIMPIVKDIVAQTVKAMGFALDRKCCGVSTLEALAYNNIAWKGTICTVMKARAELVYTCTYKSDGYGLEQLCDERIISCDQLAEELAFGGTEVLLCGDGAADFFMTYRSPMFTIAPPQGRIQNACGVCLAALSKEPVTADELEVSYLQKVKAEKDLEDKNK